MKLRLVIVLSFVTFVVPALAAARKMAALRAAA